MKLQLLSLALLTPALAYGARPPSLSASQESAVSGLEAMPSVQTFSPQTCDAVHRAELREQFEKAKAYDGQIQDFARARRTIAGSPASTPPTVLAPTFTTPSSFLPGSEEPVRVTLMKKIAAASLLRAQHEATQLAITRKNELYKKVCTAAAAATASKAQAKK